MTSANVPASRCFSSTCLAFVLITDDRFDLLVAVLEIVSVVADLERGIGSGSFVERMASISEMKPVR